MLLSTIFGILAVMGGRQAARPLSIEPLPPPREGQYGFLGFRIEAPWMQGSICLRMPETLQSSAGLHFIDHDRADMRPLHKVAKHPAWVRDCKTQAIRYTLTLEDGVVMCGEAVPESEAVRLAFTVKNGSRTALEAVQCQMCLVLTNSRVLSRREDLAPVHGWWDGAFRSFARTSPAPEQVGRPPWVLMLTEFGRERWLGPRSYPDGWWVVDQIASSEVIARISEDGKHLVAIAWASPPVYLMTNTRIPCLHAGPTDAVRIAPGEAHTWRGMIWVLPNSPGLLARRFAEFRRGTAGVQPGKPH